jgi:phytoene/squalene synthetase
MVKLVDRVGIDIERTKAFFEAMLSDTKTKRYETYEQLQHYMF